MRSFLSSLRPSPTLFLTSVADSEEVQTAAANPAGEKTDRAEGDLDRAFLAKLKETIAVGSRDAGGIR